MQAGNLLVCATTLFTGETFAHINHIAEFMNLHFISPITNYNIQRMNLIPVIMAVWETQKMEIVSVLYSKGQPLRLVGDGRLDSPGFSAKYCTYSMVDMTTQKVVAFGMVEVTD